MNRIWTTAAVSVIVFSMFLTSLSLVQTQSNEWSEPQQLTVDPADEYYASIMQDHNGVVWLVWVREEPTGRAIWHKNSLDGGSSWSSEERLVVDIPSVGGTSIFQDSTGRIWVAWGGGPVGSQDVFYITSDDDGFSWSAVQQLTNYSGDDNIPSLVEVSGEVWIVFRSCVLSGSEDIWYRKTANGGATWSDPVQLTFQGRNYSPNAMVDSSGTIWVVWGRSIPEGEIYYITYDGTGWSEPQALTATPSHEEHANIVEDVSGRIFVFYGFTGATKDVWYQTTVDGGNSWSDCQRMTDDIDFNNNVPCALLISDETCVIWQSDRSGNGDIWLAKLVPTVIPATIDIDPDTLNLKSNGQWITAYITLLDGYNVEDIVLETVEVEGIVAEWGEIQDGVFMAKFDRATVQASVTSEPDYESAPKFYDLTLTVTGELLGGILFEGSDTITVIKK